MRATGELLQRLVASAGVAPEVRIDGAAGLEIIELHDAIPCATAELQRDIGLLEQEFGVDDLGHCHRDCDSHSDGYRH